MDTPPLLYKSVHVTFVFWVPKTPPTPYMSSTFVLAPPPPAVAANIADKDRFATLCSYLDIAAFTVVQGLALTEEAIISPATFFIY